MIKMVQCLRRLCFAFNACGGYALFSMPAAFKLRVQCLRRLMPAAFRVPGSGFNASGG